VGHNYFHHHRARGLLIQSFNGVIEENTFRRASGGGILLFAGDDWAATGAGVGNVAVIGNSVDSVGQWYRSAILGAGFDGSLRYAKKPPFVNLSLENNVVSNFPGRCWEIVGEVSFERSGNQCLGATALQALEQKSAR